MRKREIHIDVHGISNQNIDGGKAFDWGKTSSDYAKFRDIYPQEFYDRILNRNLCTTGQRVLDVGTGTGVLPRNMYRYGAKWTGTDISENQIRHAKVLSEGLDIEYHTLSTEKLDFPDCYLEKFELVYHEEYPLCVHFTREGWNGRMKACRGIGASLTDREIAMWEQEHRKLLAEIAPEEFDILHYGAMAELRKKKDFPWRRTSRCIC